MPAPGVFSNYVAVQTAQTPSVPIRACFAGNFTRGPINEAIAITSIDEFITNFGLPTEYNYNDWYQVARFLEYHKGIYVTRAVGHSKLHTSYLAKINTDIVLPTDMTSADSRVRSFDIQTNPFKVELLCTPHKFDRFTIEGENATNDVVYTLVDEKTFTFVPSLQYPVKKGAKVICLESLTSASLECSLTPTFSDYYTVGDTGTHGLPSRIPVILNSEHFELERITHATNLADENKQALIVIARTPGAWANKIEFAFVKHETLTSTSFDNASVFPGFTIKHLRDMLRRDGRLRANASQYMFIKYNESIVETHVSHNMSTLLEQVNASSKYLYMAADLPADVQYHDTLLGNGANMYLKPLRLLGGSDYAVSTADLLTAYKIFDDVETYRLDCVIGNELDAGLSAIALAERRKDCIAFVGAPKTAFLNANNGQIVNNLLNWRNMYTVDNVEYADTLFDEQKVEGSEHTRTANNTTITSSFVVLIGNYAKTYDAYNDKKRLINLAGDIAGLRAAANEHHGSFTAAAGVKRGKITTAHDVLLFTNLSQTHRDILYAASINPVIALRNYGNIFWGNRTLATLEDNFSSIHIRSLCNEIVRSVSDLLKTYVMDNIDNYMIQSVIGSINPYMTKLKGAGGLEDFKVECFSPERNTLSVVLFVKPTGVAEFITIRLVNTGTETIAYAIEQETLSRRY